MNYQAIRLNYLLIFALFALLVSCSQYRPLTIEIQKPPKIAIPDEISSLTLMNRSITDDFFNFNEDSLQKIFFTHQFDVNSNVLDSMASDTCIKALGEMLFESGRYDVVIPQDRNIKKDLKFYMTENPLEWPFVDTICKTYKTDALLVLERYINRVITDFTVNLSYSKQENYHNASIDVIYNAYFRLYDPRKKQIIGQYVILDTIFWENSDVSKIILFRDLPTVKKCLINTGIKVALDLDDQLSPEWVPQKRGYFIIDPENEIEKQLTQESDWEKLIDYWKGFTNSNKKAIKSKAEFNMAIANEMLGNYDQATSWVLKSYKTLYRKQTENYLSQLKSRKAELKKIEQKTS